MNLPSSSNREYSKFKRLRKSVVSNANARCWAVFGYCESLKTVLTQCEVFLIFSQPLICEMFIRPIT